MPDATRVRADAARFRASIVGALLLLLIGASTSREATDDEARLVLLPLNVEEVPPEFLADGTEVMDAVLARELERRGVSFVQLSLVDGIRRWARATDAIGGLVVGLDGIEPESLQQARRTFVTSLIDEFGAVGVIWPDVRIRLARMSGSHLRWDGVEEPIPGGSLAKHTVSPARGSSLRVRLFDSAAERISDVHRGLEVIDSLRVLKKGTRGRFVYMYAVRDDLFERESILDAAAHEAFAESLP